MCVNPDANASRKLHVNDTLETLLRAEAFKHLFHAGPMTSLAVDSKAWPLLSAKMLTQDLQNGCGGGFQESMRPQKSYTLHSFCIDPVPFCD